MQFATKFLALSVFIASTIAACSAVDDTVVEAWARSRAEDGGRTTPPSTHTSNPGTTGGSAHDAGASSDNAQPDPGNPDPGNPDPSQPDPAPSDDAGSPDPDPTMPDPVAPSGACTNDADTAVRGAHDMNAAAANCASGCLGAGPCTATCLVGNPGLSSACATCYGAASQCTIDHCFWECIGGNTPGCGTCRAAQGCDAAFNTCSGLM